eukprot:symbB.v1.2.040240.t1/scaffold7093.1/size13368/2
MSLAIGTFDSYAAPPAVPPDCVSYNTKGACCPSLACYKDLPLGIKIFVTILLLLAMRGSVRKISENPGYANAGKCIFVLAVATQAQVSMAYSQHALETRNGSFEEMLRARTSRASCREPSDEEMIRSKVEQSGGFNRLDSIIFEFRLKAFQEMLHELQESTREQLKSEIQNMTGYGVSNLDEQCLEAQGFQVEKKAGGVMGWMICMAPVMLIVGLIALPFIVLCAPCILLYRHRMAAKTELSVAKMDVFVDPEPGKDVMIGQAHTHSAKSRSSSKRDSGNDRIGSPSGPPGPPTGSPRSPGGPPAPETPTAWGAANVDEEIGEDGKDDELMLQRLEMARKMAPQLFN